MTHRLFALARRDWASFDGQMASQNVDPLVLPVDRFLSLVYWWATYQSEDQLVLEKFKRQLWMPPKGVAPAPGSPWSPEAETAAFGSLAATFGASARQGAPAPGP